MYNVRYNGCQFSWDEDKERSNRRKHGVSFDEAVTVFRDTHAQDYFDSTYSDDEDRFLLVGMSSGLRVLLICHCYLQDSSTIRIISARKANGQETQAYQRQRHDA